MYENEQKKIFFYRLKNQSHSLWDLHLSIDFRLNSEFVNDFKNEKKKYENYMQKKKHKNRDHNPSNGFQNGFVIQGFNKNKISYSLHGGLLFQLISLTVRKMSFLSFFCTPFFSSGMVNCLSRVWVCFLFFQRDTLFRGYLDHAPIDLLHKYAICNHCCSSQLLANGLWMTSDDGVHRAARSPQPRAMSVAVTASVGHTSVCSRNCEKDKNKTRWVKKDA